VGGYRLDLSGSGDGPVTGSCEHGDYHHDHQLVNKDSSPWIETRDRMAIECWAEFFFKFRLKTEVCSIQHKFTILILVAGFSAF
jgi:hypothetical protein